MHIEITSDFIINSRHDIGEDTREFFFQWRQSVTKELPVFCGGAKKVKDTEHLYSDKSIFETLRSMIFNVCSAEKSSFIVVDHRPKLISLFPSTNHHQKFACFISLIDDSNETIDKIYIEGVIETKKMNSKLTHFAMVIHDGVHPYSEQRRAIWKQSHR